MLRCIEILSDYVAAEKDIQRNILFLIINISSRLFMRAKELIKPPSCRDALVTRMVNVLHRQSNKSSPSHGEDAFVMHIFVNRSSTENGN